MAVRHGRGTFEHRLNVPEVIDQVGENDHVKCSRQSQIMGVRVHKMEVGMTARRDPDHFAGEVHSHAKGRANCSQEIAERFNTGLTADGYEAPFAELLGKKS